MTPDLNHIIILPAEGAGTTLRLVGPLFIVESTNTAEARIQSTSTPNGNEHMVQKFALDSLIGTNVAGGEFVLVPSTADNEIMIAPIARVQLLL